MAAATYVFDLGYYDYSSSAKLDKEGCRIVTRLKSNTPLEIIEENPVAGEGPVTSVSIGYLPARQAKSRKNPFQDPVREVCVRSSTPVKSCACLVTISTPARKRLPLFTKGAGELSCFYGLDQAELGILKKFFGDVGKHKLRIQITVYHGVLAVLRSLAHVRQKQAITLLTFTRLVTTNLIKQNA